MKAKKILFLFVFAFGLAKGSVSSLPPALHNLALTCYINALLQNLYNIPEFVEQVQTDTSEWGRALKLLFDDFKGSQIPALEAVFKKVGLETGTLAERYQSLVNILKKDIFTGDLSKRAIWSDRIKKLATLDPIDFATYETLDKEVGYFLCNAFKIYLTYTLPEKEGGGKATRLIERNITSFTDAEFDQITVPKTRKTAEALKEFFPKAVKAGAHDEALDTFVSTLELERMAGDSSELFQAMALDELGSLFQFQLEKEYWCHKGSVSAPQFYFVSKKTELAVSLFVSPDKTKKEILLTELLAQQFGVFTTMQEFKTYLDVPALLKDTKKQYVIESITENRDQRMQSLNDEIKRLELLEKTKSINTIPCKEKTMLDSMPQVLVFTPTRKTEGYFYTREVDENEKAWRIEIKIENIDINKIPNDLKYEETELFDGIITVPLSLDLSPYLSLTAKKSAEEKKYGLLGGVVYSGKFHYYAILRNCRDGLWYLCNDTPLQIKTISEEEALKKLSGKQKPGFATMLFYRKQTVIDELIKKATLTKTTDKLFADFAKGLEAIL
ncbi:MAG: hypothetical protein UV38_C0002G0049 [candidate division TM6 bacterium GW2011_GWE2_42_60]|nr:MAG: hypothetical protein UV38_C0002G0049 [candidate division TM6 bacterium GW2011_GWE2_42_60]HBY06195.1 hypothetical protein [Candidatus Dependentiae bacterium]